MRGRARGWPIAQVCTLLVVLAAAHAPVAAVAGNEQHPRTPVLWPEPATCMVEVDRRVDPVVHLEYAVPQDDIRPPGATDEVDDSRTHQFFAFCRQRGPDEFPPNWISEADVMAAASKGLVTEGSADDPEDVLDTSPDWAGCFSRITPDAPRLPITVDQAATGVDWDTTGLAPGPWSVEGYTWEPEQNRWWPRAGVVRVFESDDWIDNPPAAGLLRDPEAVEIVPDVPFVLEACVHAMPDSRFTAQWARFGPDSGWVDFISDEAITSASFSVELLAPEEIHGATSVALRIVVTDPMGRSTVATMNGDPVAVLTQGPPECEENDSFAAGEACLDSETGSANTDPGREGCACATRSRPSPLAALGLLSGIALARRRRRSRHRPPSGAREPLAPHAGSGA